MPLTAKGTEIKAWSEMSNQEKLGYLEEFGGKPDLFIRYICDHYRLRDDAPSIGRHAMHYMDAMYFSEDVSDAINIAMEHAFKCGRMSVLGCS